MTIALWIMQVIYKAQFPALFTWFTPHPHVADRQSTLVQQFPGSFPTLAFLSFRLNTTFSLQERGDDYRTGSAIAVREWRNDYACMMNH
jgi:hypothetical protein